MGNALDLPFRKSWIRYSEWSKEWNSDIIHLSAFGTHIIALNTLEDVIELFEKRSANYSSRPTIELFKFLGMDNLTSALPYGNRLRQHRRVLEEGFKKEFMSSYNDMYAEKVHILLDQLLHEAAAFPEHFKIAALRLASSVTMAIAYGYDIVPGQKDDIADSAAFLADTSVDLAVPGRTWLLVFGFLGHIPPWVPGASTQRLCAKVREASRRSRNGPFEYAKQKIEAGTSKNCLLSRLFERGDESCKDEEMLKDALATLYTAGVITMRTIQTIFVLAMTLHPLEQKRAREEIDSVIGSDRLPTFSDRPFLPYVEALYREVLRWRIATPLGVAHSTLSDDTYKGFYIPKGSYVFPNIWAITRNEDVYPDPESFRPERFFKEDGVLNDDTVDYVFGFGRRICPGKGMANNVLWLMMVSMLAVFNISKAKDKDGQEIEVDPYAFTDALGSEPLPFKCSIISRSPRAESLIMSAASAAKLNITTN